MTNAYSSPIYNDTIALNMFTLKRACGRSYRFFFIL